MAKKSHTTHPAHQGDRTLADDQALVAANLAKMLASTEDRRDPVLEYGRQLGASIKRYNDLDEKNFAARRERRDRDETMFKHAREHEYDRENALRAIIATMKASSLEGVAVQLAEAITLTGFLEDSFPEEEETFQVKENFRGLNRLLYSALAFVDETSSQKLSSFMEYPWGDPWTTPEDENARYAAREKKKSAPQFNIEHKGLEVAIDDHRRAHAAWKETAAPNGDLECEGEAYEAFAAAEYAFVEQQCLTPEDVQRKVAYATECQEMALSVQLDITAAGTHYQTVFLKSLMLGASTSSEDSQ